MFVLLDKKMNAQQTKDGGDLESIFTQDHHQQANLAYELSVLDHLNIDTNKQHRQKQDENIYVIH